MNKEWRHKEQWVLCHSEFTVEISRHTVQAHNKLSSGPNRWCVYVYVYPDHPLFPSIDLFGDIWQDSLASLPLHGGCTFFWVHRKSDVEVVSVQIGCDYSHNEDDYYTQLDSKEEAVLIFQDAENLFNQMLAKTETNND